MEKYQVQKVVPCADCRGSGSILNPLWLNFLEEHPPGSLRSMSADDYRILLRKYKLVGVTEELACTSCDGTGLAATMVELEDVPLVVNMLERLTNLENAGKIKTTPAAGPATGKDADKPGKNDAKKKFNDEFNEKFGFK